ncbi:MAG: DUF4440 domain-containing protein [Alphaproteobacteria bacterium]
MSAADGIAATNVTFEQNVAAGNAAGVAACYTEDAMFMIPNAAPLVGRAAIEGFFAAAGEGGITSIVLQTDEVLDFGDTANEVGTYELKAGDATADKGSFVVIWKKTADGWKLYRDIIASTQPAPAG